MSHHHHFSSFITENENCDEKMIILTNCKSISQYLSTQSPAADHVDLNRPSAYIKLTETMRNTLH